MYAAVGIASGRPYQSENELIKRGLCQPDSSDDAAAEQEHHSLFCVSLARHMYKCTNHEPESYIFKLACGQLNKHRPVLAAMFTVLLMIVVEIQQTWFWIYVWSPPVDLRKRRFSEIIQ